MVLEGYKTVGKLAHTEYIEKRSKFIGHICAVTTEEEALCFIHGMKKKYFDATHNIYAYALREGQIRRFSDDGEPQGTAGIPTLEVLIKEEIVDCVVVITRYFGGTMLGAGGLVRAYSHTAKEAVLACGIVEMELFLSYKTQCNYSQYEKIMSLVSKFGGKIMSCEFLAEVLMDLAIAKQFEGSFLKELCEATNGSVILKFEEEKYFSK